MVAADGRPAAARFAATCVISFREGHVILVTFSAMPRIAVLTLAGTVVVVGGCGGAKTPRSSHGTYPQIVPFDGPSVVTCAATGQTKPLPFTYAATNATAIRPEIDGAALRGRYVYGPRSGTD